MDITFAYVVSALNSGNLPSFAPDRVAFPQMEALYSLVALLDSWQVAAMVQKNFAYIHLVHQMPPFLDEQKCFVCIDIFCLVCGF